MQVICHFTLINFMQYCWKIPSSIFCTFITYSIFFSAPFTIKGFLISKFHFIFVIWDNIWRGWTQCIRANNRVLSRFFDKVGHETTYTFSGNNKVSPLEKRIFSLNNVTLRLTQNFQQPPRTSQYSDFQCHFSVFKIGRIFSKKSMKNIGLGDQL